MSPSLRRAWLDGAWVRNRRVVGEGEPSEPSEVLWLQAGPWFADLRVAKSAAVSAHALDHSQAFSGRLDMMHHSGNDVVVTWHHDLDTVERGARGDDTASLSQCDGEMVESGEGYVEWWRRADEPYGARAFVLEHEACDAAGHVIDARIVRVGGVAIAVWSGQTRGGFSSTEHARWEPEREVGELPRRVDVVGALHAAVDERVLTDRWRWREV